MDSECALMLSTTCINGAFAFYALKHGARTQEHVAAMLLLTVGLVANPLTLALASHHRHVVHADKIYYSTAFSLGVAVFALSVALGRDAVARIYDAHALDDRRLA